VHEATRGERPQALDGRDGGGLDDPGFDYRVTESADGVVVSLRGELDLASAPVLQRELLEVLEGSPERVALDLRDLTFLDSSGLGSLYRARQVADDRGVPFRLEGVPDQVRRVLDVTAMTPLFDLD
jgi:anti-sigma B factor antagonist